MMLLFATYWRSEVYSAVHVWPIHVVLYNMQSSRDLQVKLKK